MMSANPTKRSKQRESERKRSENIPEIEISPYIKAVMEGAPPRYLEGDKRRRILCSSAAISIMTPG